MWEQILVEHPTDLLAIKFAHDMSYFLGETNNIRDCVARVYKRWEKERNNTKTMGYIQGMYAFGLEETNLNSRAEEMGRKAFATNNSDTWAVHAVAHVMEMVHSSSQQEGRQKEGIKWLDYTYGYWKDCLGLYVHNC